MRGIWIGARALANALYGAAYRTGWVLALGALAFGLTAAGYPARDEPPGAPGGWLGYALAGCAAHAGAGAPFVLPGGWFALLFFGLCGCAFLPGWRLRNPGCGRPLAAGSRLGWWCGLGLWVPAWCGAYLALGAGCMAAVGGLRGCRPPGRAGPAAWAVVWLTLCVLGLLAAEIAVFAAPAAGALAGAALLVCGAYWDHPLLWPRYGMLVRCAAARPGGYSLAGAAAYLALSYAAALGLGALGFLRLNLLSRR